MITIFGNDMPVPVFLQSVHPILVSLLANTLAWLIVALVVYLLFTFAFKWLTRRLPGELDDVILGIVRKPAVAVVILSAILSDIELLPIQADVLVMARQLASTVLVALAAYVAYRIMKDVALYYGERRALESTSRTDDWIFPIVRMFAPIVIAFVAALVILPQWGIDAGAILAGAGLTGLILGLALQEPLANVFAGVGLLTDSPFALGDLIVLPDRAGGEQICRVERIGLRTTELYHVDEHAQIYVPNKDLVALQIKNITKPTVDLKVSLVVGLSYGVDYRKAQEVMLLVCREHPNVLAAHRFMERKINCIRSTTGLPGVDALADSHKRRIALQKLEYEHALHGEIESLQGALRSLQRDIAARETGGFNARELHELAIGPIAAVGDAIKRTVGAMEGWLAQPDPWVTQEEAEAETKRWRRLNADLDEKWQRLARMLRKPRQDMETRLDDAARLFHDWLSRQYKPFPEQWKEPQVKFRAFGSSSLDVGIDFYIDDIRLEHFYRRNRVLTEVAIGIFERFRAIGIEIPFPQNDVWFRNALPGTPSANASVA